MTGVNKEYIITSAEAMIELGAMLVKSDYKKFGLIGKLGAGKTHFTKGVALGLGLDPEIVHSPTYVYFHEYKSLGHYDTMLLGHYDTKSLSSEVTKLEPSNLVTSAPSNSSTPSNPSTPSNLVTSAPSNSSTPSNPSTPSNLVTSTPSIPSTPSNLVTSTPSNLLHVDMYRMTDPMLLVKSGLTDIMDDYDYWCIEWPKFDWLDNEDILEVDIEIVDENTRKVTIRDHKYESFPSEK